jgi:photosystem II stability/assembly factor-like uncharacterized protein
MRSIIAYTLAVIGVFTCAYLLSQKENAITKTEHERVLDQKMAPHDHFDFMRIDQAMHETYMQSMNGIRSNGFNEDWVIEGPGNIGARINTIALPEGQEDTIYIGYARGGIYRTYNAGLTWESIFDDQERLCIGSISINPENSAVIYAGTGDKNIGGSFSTGVGLFKSTDYGDSWTYVGLSDQKIISEVAINPLDTSILYVAAMGSPSLPDSNRGLYKSIDAGATWSQILFIGDSAGITDIAVNPNNPDIIYASGWNRIRTNQTSVISGNAAQIWKTTDGGDNWTALSNGLPSTPNGRVGIGMFTPNPDTLYSLFVGTDAQLQGIYRTLDGGDSWTAIPTTSSGVNPSALGGFGWYFSSIHVNPYDYQDVFFDGVQLWRTQNGGSSWSEADPAWWMYEVHADKHDMVFLDANKFLIATDGGLYRTVNDAATWNKIENNKTNEIYRVEHTQHTPNSYYGGLQDNGSTGGNASITNWPRIYGGDGFQMRFHPSNQNLFYAETQNGNIVYTENNGNAWNNTNFPQTADRTNWDTPYMLSYHDPQKMYAAGHQVFRDDFAPYGVWSPISGDLTDGNIYGSGFHTISGLDESQINPNRLYACTTDGNVWRTTNGGTTWDSIHASLPNRYVTSVKASPTNVNHVFVTHSGYKYNDFFSHVHKSTNNGNSWVSIAGDLPPVAVNDIIIYPNHADSVLFIGTDAGVYATKDGGLDWERLGANMPLIAVLDLTIDTVNNRLVAATVGKSIMTYPLDSLVMPANGSSAAAFEVVFTISDQTCSETPNGSILTNINGGVPPFSYAWSTGQSSNIIENLYTNPYLLTVTDAMGDQVYTSATVGYNPIHPDPSVGPLAANSAALAWQSFNYSVPANIGNTYLWNVDGGVLLSASANTASIQWEAGPLGKVMLEVTNNFGCAAADTFDVGIEFVGIDEASESPLKIFPNPSNGQFSIQLEDALPEAEIRIYNTIGQVVHKQSINNKSRLDLNLDLPVGSYLISIISEGEKTNQWIVIE